LIVKSHLGKLGVVTKAQRRLTSAIETASLYREQAPVRLETRTVRTCHDSDNAFAPSACGSRKSLFFKALQQKSEIDKIAHIHLSALRPVLGIVAVIGGRSRTELRGMKHPQNPE
jgi:hypothetical protein